jgi:DNA-binding response OmpR family regulator
MPLVLIVEDNQDLRTYLHESLAASYHILEANNGLEGYKQAIERIPDLVLSDVMMPKMDGTELCQKLKTDERTSHIPIILLTAKGDRESKLEGLEIGADEYLTKPFEFTELLVRIKNLIEGRKKLRECYSREITWQPSAISITSADERFLQKLMQVLDESIADSTFGVEQLGQELAMSRMQLFRKLKALTNQSPGEFIRSLRLQRGAELLAKGAGTVAEVAFLVGFNDPSYFTKCFQKQYGKTPSEYIESIIKAN